MATHQLSSSHLIYAMSAGNRPALRVHSGDRVVIETADCFENQIRSESQDFGGLDWERINPATGPIYVEEAEPGDILAIHIEKMELVSQGVMTTGPGLGVLGDELEENHIRMIQVSGGRVNLFGREVPTNPMIGVIGTAPSGDMPIPCGTPGDHGGNMDCKRITEGAILLLPVNVPGALFALGDLHASMGDGEVAVCGVEIAGKVTVKLHVLKGLTWPTPMVVDAERVMTIASAATLDEAAVVATKRMAHWMSQQTGISGAEAIFLLSAKGELRICQVVDPLKTARMEFDRAWLEKMGISFGNL
ncbi:acetamidase/formamidase family protein [Kyrpidia tusciae]|uniref:Acetamidase/Formamidase n=1 Tax=Kyrpidia tusciae (strain DSM 2912 / NBRC 15312 / T2) TaxID=562970 RepID=D5WY30_KYRT2|nr:acetamidase/formamidase family protein [Kyrpidia tusciae]ADG06089.1 Acetamidase/Formamidase [Kyrpidia tusciae DSM 2912]